MRHAVPTLFQPPWLVKVANTSSAEFRGHITTQSQSHSFPISCQTNSPHNTIIVMMNPPRCPKSDIVSIIGRVPAPQVLKKIVMNRKAMLINVYCQFGNAKSALVISIRTSMSVAQTNTLEAQLASQPRVDIQPAEYERNFWYLAGANSLTQWYCPPLVGAIDSTIGGQRMLQSRQIRASGVGGLAPQGCDKPHSTMFMGEGPSLSAKLATTVE
jgi:hypothetical protein